MPGPTIGLPKRISELAEANLPLAGDEQVAVVQDETTRRATVDAFRFASSGATADRPTLTSAYAGYQYYDTTLGIPIWWDGTEWTDAAGVTA